MFTWCNSILKRKENGEAAEESGSGGGNFPGGFPCPEKMLSLLLR